MERIEQLVCRFRGELKISGLPEDRHAWELASHLGERLVVEVSRHSPAYTLPGPIAIVTLPAGWSAKQLAKALLHEIGHVLCCEGTPVHLVSPDLRVDRLLRLWEGREEAQARQFILSWLWIKGRTLHLTHL